MAKHRIIADMSDASMDDNADCLILMKDGAGNATICQGNTVPTNGVAGYAHGCIFIHLDGTAYNDALYCNISTASSPDWNVVTVAS